MKVLFVPSSGVSALNRLRKDTLRRCKRGLRLWQSGRYDYLLLSGGIFNPPNIQTVPASLLMRNWFLAHSVDGSKIITEEESLDTFENVKFGIKELEEKGLSVAKIAVVSQWQHVIFRIFPIFLLGYGRLIRPHPMWYFASIKDFFREAIAILIFILYCLMLDPKGEKFLSHKRRQRLLKQIGVKKGAP